ncbi:MAG TPA: hypothetical protein DEA69_13870 [Microbacterium sp.]|uniref:hypothetical protein n=1 Tax=unclassified Microbacterium TaxID=2609290 RepID=UPI000E9F2F8A|nr:MULTISPECIES: hypothetical protein [unclassified Microbacterium]HBS09858.1 hypothetical protein [Microbacterium sp.]
MNRRRPFRAASIVIAAMLGVGALAGCGPTDPSPAPTPTGFASEEEAFAAAEATYRAYVDALNQVDLSDPSTFEEVYRWTMGDANAGARESFSQMHADGWRVSGESKIVSVQSPAGGDRPDDVGVAIACLDVSAVTLDNAEGNSVVDPDRPDIQAIAIKVVPADTPTGAVIQSLDGGDASECAP